MLIVIRVSWSRELPCVLFTKKFSASKAPDEITFEYLGRITVKVYQVIIHEGKPKKGNSNIGEIATNIGRDQGSSNGVDGLRSFRDHYFMESVFKPLDAIIINYLIQHQLLSHFLIDHPEALLCFQRPLPFHLNF